MCFWSGFFFIFAIAYAGYIGDECNNSINNYEGICTPVKLCPTLLKKIQQPLSKEVINELRKTHCGFQGKDPLVCCSEDQNLNIYEGMKIVTNHPNLHLINDAGCGPFYSNRIFNGRVSILFEYPWMVLIGYRTEYGDIQYRCSGSIISQRYILTAAHCIYELERLIVGVRVGEYDTSHDPDCVMGKDNSDIKCAPPVKNYEIEELILHSTFKKRTLSCDIGLIRLKKPITFNENIQPICLPVGEELQKNILKGKISNVAGWGATERGEYNRVLLKTYVAILPISKCIDLYPKRLNLTDAQMCAGGGNDGSDTCRGDSGGPLFHPISTIDMNPKWYQFGIVSFGPKKCGTNGMPAVYTRVGYFIEWILNNITD